MLGALGAAAKPCGAALVPASAKAASPSRRPSQTVAAMARHPKTRMVAIHTRRALGEAAGDPTAVNASAITTITDSGGSQRGILHHAAGTAFRAGSARRSPLTPIPPPHPQQTLNIPQSHTPHHAPPNLYRSTDLSPTSDDPLTTTPPRDPSRSTTRKVATQIPRSVYHATVHARYHPRSPRKTRPGDLGQTMVDAGRISCVPMRPLVEAPQTK